MKKGVKTLSILLSMMMCTTLIGVKAEEEPSYTKDESVYVILNSDGSVDNTTVTEWLHSDNGLNNIKDKTNLKDIKNISSDVLPTINGEDVTWNTSDTDIYYQGSSDKKLPISMNVEYKLDGSIINPNELVGKSGNLEINIKLKNNLETTKTINGKQEVITTLFPVVMIVNMPSEQFNNIDVNSGTVISEGKNQIVTMTSVLGLNKALELMDNEELDKIKDKVNDSFTIKAKVTNMDVPSIMLASTKVTDDEISVDGVDFSELTNGINDLKDATNTILDGTVQLRNANIELNDKMGEFQAKINEFNNGVNSANDGSVKLQEGANALADGTALLQGEVNKLLASMNGFDVNKFNEILGLCTKVMEELNSTVPAQLQQMDNALKDASTQLANIDEVIKAQANHEVIKAQIVQSGATNLIIENITGQINAGIDDMDLSDEQIQGLKDAIVGSIKVNVEQNQDAYNTLIATLVEAGKTEDEAKALVGSAMPSASVSVDEGMINGALGSLMTNIKEGAKYSISTQLGASKDMLDEGIATIGDGIVASVATQVKATLAGKIEEMQGMIGQAQQLLDTMNEYVKEINGATSEIDFSNIKGLASKLPEAQKGIQQIVDGSKQLAAGTNDLHNGMLKLQEGSGQVVDAVNQFKDATQKLAESTGELNDGVAKFSNEGIDKLDTKVNDAINELDNVVDVAKAYIDNTNDYTSYGDSVDGVDASVKFIMKTKEIIKEEEVETVQKTEVETTFWDRVTNLFN